MVTGGLRGPGWRVFDARPDRVREVRDWIRSVVTRHGGSADPDDAMTAVSEVFTNSVVHGPAGGRVLVSYWLWSGGALLAVCDGGSRGTPQVRQVTIEAQGGRGLHVVDEITTWWGTFRSAGNRVVWCIFGKLPPVPPDVDEWAWLHWLVAVEAPLAAPGSRERLPEPGAGDADLAAPVSCVKGGASCGTGLRALAAPLTAPALAGGGHDR